MSLLRGGRIVKWATWLIEKGEISREQLDDAIHLSRLRQIPVEDALLKLGYIDPWPITQAFSVEYGCPLYDFYNNDIPAEIIKTIPDIVVRELRVCPVIIREAVLWYATPYVADKVRCTRLAQILNREVQPMWAPNSWILHAFNKYYTDCHVTDCGCAMPFDKYGDDDWIMVDGNRYWDYKVSRLGAAEALRERSADKI
jgi:hypothetical protein